MFYKESFAYLKADGKLSISYDNLEKTFCCISAFGGKIKKKILFRSGMKDSIINLATAAALKRMIQKKESGHWEGGGRRKPSHLVKFSHVLLVKCLNIFSLKLYSVHYEVKYFLWSQQCNGVSHHLR